jgi:leader peptidase (prepilin peptidase)/N-methyltransferase
VTAAVLVFSGLFGLAFGSFLNVVLYRMPRGESLSAPPSRCPSCGTRLAWRDNIPVLSWLTLRGRCRYCASPISAQYPLVELAVALGFVAIALALV